MASYYSGVTLTREQAAQVAYQAGFRGDDLAKMVAIAGRESGYIAGAHRTNSSRSALSGDRGLWQINKDAWDAQLIAAGIIRQASDLFDPLTNAKAAKYVFDKQGLAAWGMGDNGWAAGGNAMARTDLSAAQAAVASAASQGLIGKDYNQGGASTTAAGTPTVGLPSDARLVEVPGVARYAMFRIQPGLWIRYAITADSGINTAGRYFTKMTQQEWGKTFGNSVQGGNASELAEIPTAFGTYAQYTNAILDQVFPKGDPRRNDPEIMRVLATRAGRPDMTEAEFENLLKGTKYYQSRTEGQLRWNDLSEAERQAQRADTAVRMAQTYLSLTGQTITVDELMGTSWVEDVASGKIGFGQWTEQTVKPYAAKIAESPWSRQLRDEREAQLQRPIDIENSVSRVRDTLTRWGVGWSEQTIQNWGRDLVENKKSDDDLLNTIKQSAAVLFPWKDPEMETVVAAAPWIETYNRVLERQGSLQTSEIARVLSAYGRDPDNNDPWSFEQRLKMTDQYDQTRQGQDDAWSTTAELAGMMGF